MSATDKNRSLFLKGFNLSNQGSYEDPTYLGFKLVFDFGALPVDPNTGIAPSPLFKDGNYLLENNPFVAENPFGQKQYEASPKEVYSYSAQQYLKIRESDFDQGNPASRLSLFENLGNSFDRLNEVNRGGKRADMLRQFKVLLQDINKNSPWFFQSISGLDEIVKVERSTYGERYDFNPQRTADSSITINCLESFNLRVSSLAELYRQATFDYEYMRELLPRNLRYFKMYIFVTEIRNINKTARLSGTAAAVKAVEDLSSLLGSNMNPGNKDFLSNLQGVANKVTPGGSNPGGSFNSFVGNFAQAGGATTNFDVLKEASDQSGIKPVLIYECDQCEFNFDETYPFSDVINNGTDSAESAKATFKITIGRVKTRSQFPNIRSDGLPLVLSDGWDSFKSSVQRTPRFGENLANDLFAAGQDLATNFISNSISDMITESVANITSNSTGQPIQSFEGVYNFSTSQDFLSPDNLYYSGSSPQESGLGGPLERVYRSPSGDAYPGSPGKDLGPPERLYKDPTGDSYESVPGPDLGPPGRIYKDPSGDQYPEVPGKDLGPPERIYNPPSGDVYDSVPGSSLGSPERIYNGPDDDVYPGVPGESLGPPGRIYPGVSDDMYSKVPGSDLGNPERIYKEPSGDVYPDVPGDSLGPPDRNYPNPSGDVYGNLETNKETRSLGDLYSDSKSEVGSEINFSNSYPDQIINELDKTLGSSYGDPSENVSLSPEMVYNNQNRLISMERETVYPETIEDFNPSFVNSNTYGESKIDSKILVNAEAYPPKPGNFIVPPAVDLGNLKSDRKFNVSLGDFNPSEEKFDR